MKIKTSSVNNVPFIVYYQMPVLVELERSSVYIKSLSTGDAIKHINLNNPKEAEEYFERINKIISYHPDENPEMFI